MVDFGAHFAKIPGYHDKQTSLQSMALFNEIFSVQGEASFVLHCRFEYPVEFSGVYLAYSALTESKQKFRLLIFLLSVGKFLFSLV